MSDFITHGTVFASQKLNLRHVRSKCAPHIIMIIHPNSFECDFSVLETEIKYFCMIPSHYTITPSPLSFPIFIHTFYWSGMVQYIIILLQS